LLEYAHVISSKLRFSTHFPPKWNSIFMPITRNILDLIGNTPLLQLKRLDTGPCQLFAKLENQNPGGSIKDRIALTMIESAEKSGQLQPGSTLIEATAGNTGLGLALVAAQKGYQLLLVIPDKMSTEKIAHLRALGAEIIITRSDVSKGHPEYYQDIAERLVKERPHAYYVNQFANAANVRAHEEFTGPEIWEQMDHKIDAIVVGVGTGGTLTGLGRFLRKQSPKIDIILADPEGSVLAEYIQTKKIKPAGSWLVEGIGEDFIPPICDLSLVTKAITVNDQQSFDAVRELLKKEGVLAGSSSGALLHAALTYCRAQKKPKRVVTLICDTGNKYLSKLFNDEWLHAHGLT
jgi:cystathionine beta-synthase